MINLKKQYEVIAQKHRMLIEYMMLNIKPQEETNTDFQVLNVIDQLSYELELIRKHVGVIHPTNIDDDLNVSEEDFKEIIQPALERYGK